MTRARRSSAAFLLLALSFAAAACEPSATLPAVTTVAQHSYSLCPVAGELPSDDATQAAMGVIGARLEFLGTAGSVVPEGACLRIAASSDPGRSDAVRAAVLGTGVVELLPVELAILGQVEVGGESPPGIEPLATGDDITGVAVAPSQSGGVALSIRLSDDAAAELGTWTTVHVGNGLALVVDGVVVSVPTINEPLTGETLVIEFAGSSPPVPLAAIEAMVASGPLPPEWEQPERPQG